MLLPNIEPKISFELFPARTNEMRFQLGAAVQELESHKPRFYSVTHGAFENPGDNSDETIYAVKKISNSPVAAHVAASNLKKEALLAWVDELYTNGTRKFVALRGDGFRKGDLDYYQSALEFTTALRNKYQDIDIYVSAYPEGHKDATCKDEELQYLKSKIDAGANAAITQFFFDIDKFYRWYETCDNLGIADKVVAGILPIVNFQKTLKMAQFCCTDIPASMAYQYGRFMDDPEGQKQLSIDLTIELIESLQQIGINDFHFYCLNRCDLVKEICPAILSKSGLRVA